jgi:hypothetical protein
MTTDVLAVSAISVLLSVTRLAFWRLPPHVDLAWWGGWTRWSDRLLPPDRLVEFNQGGSRLGLFLQYRIGSYLTRDLHKVQKVLDFVAVLVATFATGLYLGDPLVKWSVLALVFLTINNPRTQTYFGNCETQALAPLAVALVLLRHGSAVSSVLAGALLAYNATFFKLTFGLDLLVGLGFAPYRLAYAGGVFVVAGIWWLVQRQLAVEDRGSSFLGHWWYQLRYGGAKNLVRGLLCYGRETTASIVALALLGIWLELPMRPELLLFWGHGFVYFFQLRGHAYHAIPALYTGVLTVGPSLPAGLRLVVVVLLASVLALQAYRPDKSFALHPWRRFFKLHYETLLLKDHLQQNYTHLLRDHGLLVWSSHINLYWLLDVRPHVDWMLVSTDLSYHMIRGGHEELATMVTKHPPALVLVGDPGLDVQALERLTGRRYKLGETVADTDILLCSRQVSKPASGEALRLFKQYQ